MSPRLTLLFCHEALEFFPVLTSALESADFRLVIAHNKQEAHTLLSDRMIDAVLICQSKPRLGKSVCASLKRRAPRTPILLFTNEDQSSQPYPGIYSVVRADAQDEVLTRAVAYFLRISLSSTSAHRVPALSPPDRTAQARGQTPQAAL
jgi:DNA-binding NarL/FixJ family response regulator